MNTEGKNYYEILGVTASASDHEISVAYKRLAMKYHPDRNIDNIDDSTKVFKTISQAYNTLSDNAKRVRYDEILRNPGRTHGPYTHYEQPFSYNPFDYYQSRSSQRQYSAPTPKGAHIHTTIDIDVSQSISGFATTIEYEKIAPCDSCKDLIKRHAKPKCSFCFGSGYEGYKPCFICVPNEYKSPDRKNNCKTCKGYGYVNIKHQCDLIIPPGVSHNHTFIVEGLGYPSKIKGGANGDLSIQVQIQIPSGWTRSNHDLLSDIIIPCSTAYLGGKLIVDLPAGKAISMTIPPNTDAGAKFRVSGEGLLDGKRKVRGNVILTAVITLPNTRRKLKPEEIAVLHKLIRSEDHLGRRTVKKTPH